MIKLISDHIASEIINFNKDDGFQIKFLTSVAIPSDSLVDLDIFKRKEMIRDFNEIDNFMNPFEEKIIY